jgi:hypothetical protein
LCIGAWRCAWQLQWIDCLAIYESGLLSNISVERMTV